MNILIVEDDENKRAQIGNFIELSYPGVNIIYSMSMQSGLKSIIKGGIDLVILDMTMPTFDISAEDRDGGRPQAYAGREILKQMDRFKIRTPVIVVTQFDKFGTGSDALTLSELNAQLLQSHSYSYQGVVYYDVAVEGWKEDLSRMISNILEGTD